MLVMASVMRWIQGLNKKKRCALHLLALVCVVAMACTAGAASPSAPWPDGWSRERSIGTGVLSHGHRTASAGAEEFWVVYAASNTDGTELLIRRVGVLNGEQKGNTSIPLTHIHKGMAIASHLGGLLVTWIERNEGVESKLLYASIGTDGVVKVQRTLWSSEVLAESPDMFVDESGLVHIAFTAAEGGRHSVHLLSCTIDGELVTQATRLTTHTEMATAPVIAVSNGYLHLTHYRHTSRASNAYYNLYQLSDLKVLSSVSLGEVPEYFPYPPYLFASEGSTVTMVWQSMAQTTGRNISGPTAVAAGAATIGTLKEGQWIIPPARILNSPIRTVGVRASRGEDGRMLITWLTQSASTWQGFAVLRNSNGQNVHGGFATLTQGNVLEPRPLVVGSTGVVTFFRRLPSGLYDLSYVRTDASAKRPLSYRVGLDHNSPLSDAVYKYLTLTFGAVGWVFLAFVALAIGVFVVSVVARFGVFSSSKTGDLLRMLLLFVVIAALKRPNTILYYGAQLIPGWGAVASFIGAAVFSIAIMEMSDTSPDDTLTLTFFGLLFMLSDTFTSLFVLGVGRW